MREGEQNQGETEKETYQIKESEKAREAKKQRERAKTKKEGDRVKVLFIQKRERERWIYICTYINR